MKLLTYKTQTSESRLGFLHNNLVVDMEDFGDISNFPLPDSMLELIDMGFDVIAEINSLVEDANPSELAEISYSFDEITILAPIEKPRKNIIGIGLNYTEHVADGTPVGYLHDSRARTLTEAILWHGGEAEVIKNRFINLPTEERQALLAFLKSL
jgi:hypothetical protein